MSIDTGSFDRVRGMLQDLSSAGPATVGSAVLALLSIVEDQAQEIERLKQDVRDLEAEVRELS